MHWQIIMNNWALTMCINDISILFVLITQKSTISRQYNVCVLFIIFFNCVHFLSVEILYPHV